MDTHPECESPPYTIISADCHAGPSDAIYSLYLDSTWRKQFELWRLDQEKLLGPDAVRWNGVKWRKNNVPGEITTQFGAGSTTSKNLEDEMAAYSAERQRALFADGQVAEVVFNNTPPPFTPQNRECFFPPRDHLDFTRRLVGVRAYNRWLADWCAEAPHQRCGLPLILLNDVKEAIADLRGAARQGFRSFSLPAVSPDQGIPGLFSQHYDPMWAVVEDLGLTITQHGGSGTPHYGNGQGSGILFCMEIEFFSNRNLSHLILSGVFDRFPKLRYVMTEQGVAWARDALHIMDNFNDAIRTRKGVLADNIGYVVEQPLPLKPSEYFERNVWIGASFPGPKAAQIIPEVGVHKVLWGSDYPHHEGSCPFSREAIRYGFSDWKETDLRRLLAGNAAELYGFDLETLAPLAALHGPTVKELATPLEAPPSGATCLIFAETSAHKETNPKTPPPPVFPKRNELLGSLEECISFGRVEHVSLPSRTRLLLELSCDETDLKLVIERNPQHCWQRYGEFGLSYLNGASASPPSRDLLDEIENIGESLILLAQPILTEQPPTPAGTAKDPGPIES